MHSNIIKKQVMKAQSNKHRKAKQVQLQDFQHKEGKLNIIEMHKTMFPSLIIAFSRIMNKSNNITITRNILIMSHMHKRINTPHINIVILINCSGNKFNKIAIIIIFITIIIKYRRHIVIIINFLLNSRWTENIIFLIVIIIYWRYSIIISNRIVIFQSVFVCKHIIIGRNMDSTNSTVIINIIIFRIGTEEIFNIKSSVLFPIMITTIGNRHRNIIEFRLIKNYNRSNMLRGKYRFLSPFTPPFLLFLLLFRRERLERKLLHIPWFIVRENRRNFGGFLLFINKIKTHISPVIFW